MHAVQPLAPTLCIVLARTRASLDQHLRPAKYFPILALRSRNQLSELSSGGCPTRVVEGSQPTRHSQRFATSHCDPLRFTRSASYASFTSSTNTVVPCTNAYTNSSRVPSSLTADT